MIIYKKDLKKNGRTLYVELTQADIGAIEGITDPDERVIIDLTSAIEAVDA